MCHRAVTSVYSGPTSTVMSMVATKSVDMGSNVHSCGQAVASSVDRQHIHSSECKNCIASVDKKHCPLQETVDESAVHGCVNTLHCAVPSTVENRSLWTKSVSLLGGTHVLS